MSSPTALVTGASRGLGSGIAIELARSGFSVAIHYAGNHEAAADTAAKCTAAAQHPEAQLFPIIPGDIGSTDERNAVFAATLGVFSRLDVLVNNAGITSIGRNDITEATEESYDRVMDVNLKGPFFLSQLAANHWLSRPGECPLPGGYKLVNVSSISATIASLNRGDYCLSKAAMGMATQLWALRLAEHGAQVIEFRPGIMATDMTAGVTAKYEPLIRDGLVPQKRWGTPEDIGIAVRSFCQGNLPFSTGEIIYLDGGLHHPRL
jgi:3-oxoacyl-[acyl-carrier protein] reductase